MTEVKAPIYVNLLREPMDRLMSAVNFERHCVCDQISKDWNTWDTWCRHGCWCKNHVRMYQSENLQSHCNYTLDQLIAFRANWMNTAPLAVQQHLEKDKDANIHEIRNYYVGFFCGEDCPYEWNSPEALAIAKRRLEHEYAWVGILETPDLSFKMLKAVFPHFFNNQYFHTPIRQMHPGDLHNTKSKVQIALSEATINAVTKHLANDIEMYRFATEIMEKRAAFIAAHMEE